MMRLASMIVFDSSEAINGLQDERKVGWRGVLLPTTKSLETFDAAFKCFALIDSWGCRGRDNSSRGVEVNFTSLIVLLPSLKSLKWLGKSYHRPIV